MGKVLILLNGAGLVLNVLVFFLVVNYFEGVDTPTAAAGAEPGASKTDLTTIEAKLQKSITDLKTNLRTSTQKVASDLQRDLARLRVDVRKDIQTELKALLEVAEEPLEEPEPVGEQPDVTDNTGADEGVVEDDAAEEGGGS